jgi:hypothetical protein
MEEMSKCVLFAVKKGILLKHATSSMASHLILSSRIGHPHPLSTI